MTYYATPLTTLADVIEQSRLQDANVIDPDATIQTTIDTADANTILYLKTLLEDVSDAMQKALYRVFTPYDEAKELFSAYLRNDGFFYDYDIYSRVLSLDNVGGDDCLNIDSLDWNGTALTSSDYRFLHPTVSPNDRLVFNSNTALDNLTDFDDSVTITGTWGYHDNFSQMWRDSGDTVQNSPLAVGDTTLDVTSGLLFEIYQLIRIEDEYLFITDITDNALTVERGKNGTSAASHANDTQIDTFVQTPAIAKECRRLVVRAWYLRNPIGNVVISGAQIKELVETDLSASIIRNLSRLKVGKV